MKFLKKKLEKVKNLNFVFEIPQYQEKALKIRKKIQKRTKSQHQKSRRTQRKRRYGSPKSSYTHLCLKNVAKNFGRAICNFIVLGLADPYLEIIQQEIQLNFQEFKRMIKEKKNKLDGIDSFRELLLKGVEDTQELAKFKLAFKRLAEIFIKYFSVNWIFSGRLNYKQEYLKFRPKMLRRIRNPDMFTYIR